MNYKGEPNTAEEYKNIELKAMKETVYHEYLFWKDDGFDGVKPLNLTVHTDKKEYFIYRNDDFEVECMIYPILIQQIHGITLRKYDTVEKNMYEEFYIPISEIKMIETTKIEEF